MHKTMNRMLPILIMLITAFAVSAHEITLKNGDRLSGIVITRDRDSIVLETQYAGRIKISMEYIETIDMERPLTNFTGTATAGRETRTSDLATRQATVKRQRPRQASARQNPVSTTS